MKSHKINRYIFKLFIVLLLAAFSCENSRQALPDKEKALVSAAIPWAYQGLDEFKKGDIIVRPNLNIFPGTSLVSHGSGFGHAALVTKGFKHSNIDSLLAGIQIIESIAKDVSTDFQIREISGLVRSRFDAFNNDNFDQRYTGNRYRLRLALSEAEIDTIIAFALAQKGDRSAWNASKAFPENAFNDSLIQQGIRKNWADNANWYCSHLVWQSVFYITAMDTDANSGYMVYPNDLIQDDLFNNTENHQGRTRF
jgi:hypothetical protein